MKPSTKPPKAPAPPPQLPDPTEGGALPFAAPPAKTPSRMRHRDGTGKFKGHPKNK
jgi:hypothetical protein